MCGVRVGLDWSGALACPVGCRLVVKFGPQNTGVNEFSSPSYERHSVQTGVMLTSSEPHSRGGAGAEQGKVVPRILVEVR